MSSVEIEAGDEAGTQKVTVVSNKDGITKEEAIKSLGDKASRYVVHTWEKSEG